MIDAIVVVLSVGLSVQFECVVVLNDRGGVVRGCPARVCEGLWKSTQHTRHSVRFTDDTPMQRTITPTMKSAP